MNRAKKAKSQNKSKRKLSEAYVQRAALFYLERFSASERHLRSVLLRKMKRRLEEGQTITADHLAWLDAAIEDCKSFGYIDDKRYATSRADSLTRRGKPLRMIRQDLRAKGVSADDTDAALKALSENSADPDLSAALAYARRRGFGAYRRPDRPGKGLEKELAAMARAGFSFDLAKRVLTADGPETLVQDLSD